MKHKKILSDGKYVPQRMCVGCRAVRPKADMIRIAIYNGEIKVDKGDFKQGRGAYVCNSADCIQRAEKTKGLQRGLKTGVSPEIYEECIEFDGNKLYGMLGLATRAGKVVSGADAVIDKVRTKSTHLVIISSDASQSTVKRITDKCSFYGAQSIVYGTSAQNGTSIGKGNVAAVAVTDKNFADTILRIYKNLTEVAENGSC